MPEGQNKWGYGWSFLHKSPSLVTKLGWHALLAGVRRRKNRIDTLQ